VFYKPTVIVGEPSWLVRFSELAAERGIWPVKLMIVGGENMTERSRRNVERIWHAPVLMNYGQTEAFGSLGLECSHQHGYHRNDLHFQFEIANIGADGYGELTYTTLTRNVMPLIRYRSSDITCLLETPCDCGVFTGRIAKIVGRADEMVVCGMGNVGPWVFEELLRDVGGIGHDWQAVLTHNGRCDAIELRIEREDDADEPSVSGAVLDALRERFPDFAKNLMMRLYDFRVALQPQGSLRQGRKLRRIVDERHHATV
jgi:phenylacetate-CoA ligase